MKYNRRTFLKKTITGAAVTGFSGLGFLKSNVRGDPVSIQGIRKTSDEERKQLIAETRFGRKTPARSRKSMAITSHPLATREAVNILKSGGNACDAALCAAITQTVLQPHMVGITGYLTSMFYDAVSGKTMYVNGSVNVPLGAKKTDGTAAAWGPGVPGFWAGFEESLSRFGTKSKKELMAPAIRYAREGFEMHPFLWGEIFMESEKIGRSDAGLKIYMPDNAIPRPYEMLYQKEAADTLEGLVEEGNDYFYRGEFAEEFCRISQKGGRNITRRDMERYKAYCEEAGSGTYRGFKVRALPITHNGSKVYALPMIIETLDVLELLDIPRQGPPSESPDTMYQMIQSLNIVREDYHRSHGNPNELAVVKQQLPKELAHKRLKKLQAEEVAHDTSSGSLYEGTCAVTVADGQGNVACIVHSSNQSPFETGLWVKGVNLCALRTYGGIPGERGLQGPAGMIIFKEGKPFLAGGSPSRSLTQCMLQNTINILDFGMPIDESVNRPRYGSLVDKRGITIEKNYDERVWKAVEKRGVAFHVVNPWNFYHGAFEGIHVEPGSGMMIACGDPRRHSKAEGV